MVGRVLSLHLRRICLSDTTIFNACRFDFLCSIPSTFSAKLGRWEDTRYMGSSGGALNKWQQRRLEEKRAINKLKKGKLLAESNTNNSNSVKRSKISAKEGCKDQNNVPSDKFLKMGAVDLWNENDGPLTTVPPPTDTSKTRDALNGDKVQRKYTVKDGSGRGGSVGFKRGFCSIRRFNGLEILMKVDDLDDGDTLMDSLGKRASVMCRRAFLRGFNAARIFTEERALDGQDAMDNSLGNNGSVLFRKSFSSGSSRRFKRVGTSSEEEELDEEWYGNRPFGSKSHNKEEDTGFSSSKSKSNWRKNREFERLGSYSDEEETGRKIRKNSAIPKSLIEDEMDLDNIIDKEMTAGMRFEEELLTGKRSGQFYDNDKEAFRRSRFLSMVDSMDNISDPESGEDSSDEEDKWRESRYPKPGRIRGSMGSKRQFVRGSREQLSNSSKSYSRWHDDDDENVFRQFKSIRTGESTDAYSGHKSRDRFFNENEGRRVSRNPRTGRVEGSTPSQWGSRSKRQSMGSFDKTGTGEMGFPQLGSNRRGRSFSSFSGAKITMGRYFDFEKEVEFTQPKPSRIGDFTPRHSVQKPRRESLREKAVCEDKESGHGQTVADDNWLKFGLRLKSETSIIMEMSEDKEEELATQTLPRESCKREQPNDRVYHAKNYWTRNANAEGSHLSSSRFDQCNISQFSLQALSLAGYVQMTVMQEATLPIILEGKDVLVKAKRGTGKTLAFLLPAIEAVVKLPPPSQNLMKPIVVLILCPTRELAIQTAAEANALLKYHNNIGVQVVTEGTKLYEEKIQLETNTSQIIVATPRRLLEHIDNGPAFSNRLMGLKLLVLDEADCLLNLEFNDDLHKIIDVVPRHRQSLIFSATVRQEVRQISQIVLRRYHSFINTIVQGCILISYEDLSNVFNDELKEDITRKTDYKFLVFCTSPAIETIFWEFFLGLIMNIGEINPRKFEAYFSHVYAELQHSNGLILVTADVAACQVVYRDVSFVIQSNNLKIYGCFVFVVMALHYR